MGPNPEQRLSRLTFAKSQMWSRVTDPNSDNPVEVTSSLPTNLRCLAKAAPGITLEARVMYVLNNSVWPWKEVIKFEMALDRKKVTHPWSDLFHVYLSCIKKIPLLYSLNIENIAHTNLLFMIITSLTFKVQCI